MIQIQFQTDEVRQELERLVARVRRTLPVMREVAGILHAEVAKNFERQGRPPWQALARRTVKEKAKKGYSPDILIRSGRLASSIHARWGEGEAAAGTNVKYAAIHQFGGEIERHPVSSRIRLRTDRNGDLLRQGVAGRLAVTASRRHRQVREVRWTRETGWSVTIPARPFLALDGSGVERVLAAIRRHLLAG